LFLTIFQFLCHINFLSLLSELFTSLCPVKMLPFQTVWVGVIYFNVISLAWACKETEPVTEIKSLTAEVKQGVPCFQNVDDSQSTSILIWFNWRGRKPVHSDAREGTWISLIYVVVCDPLRILKQQIFCSGRDFSSETLYYLIMTICLVKLDISTAWNHGRLPRMSFNRVMLPWKFYHPMDFQAGQVHHSVLNLVIYTISLVSISRITFGNSVAMELWDIWQLSTDSSGI
jgi:hypothetical protein